MFFFLILLKSCLDLNYASLIPENRRMTLTLKSFLSFILLFWINEEGLFLKLLDVNKFNNFWIMFSLIKPLSKIYIYIIH